MVCHFNLLVSELTIPDSIYYLVQDLPGSLYMPVALFAILLLFQAWVLNNLFNKNELCKTETNLPAAIYILLVGLLNTTWVLTPVFMAVTFICLAINSLLGSYQKKSFTYLFNCGFYIGIASIIYPPAFVFLFSAFMAHFFLRLFNIKEWLTTLIGFVIPLYLFFIGLYFTNSFNIWFSYFSNQNYFNLEIIKPESFTEVVSIITLTGCVLFGLYMYQLRYLRTSIENRDRLVICLYFLLTGIATTVLLGANSHLTLLLTVPFVAVFMANGIYNSKKIILTEVLPIALLLVVLFLHHLSEYFSYLNFLNL